MALPTRGPLDRYPYSRDAGSQIATSPSICRGEARHRQLDLGVKLALSLAANRDERRWLVYPARFAIDLEGADELAATYQLENWESGLISGALFGLRTAGGSPGQFRLLVREFSGRLRSQDLDALAHLAAQCVTALCGQRLDVTASPEWNFDVQLEQ
jgi:hypothetical protein